MADIYGGSTSKSLPRQSWTVVTIGLVEKLIRDAISKILHTDVKKAVQENITTTLNLVDVNPDEIVVFEDTNGKLKTSNVSLGNILTRQTGVAEDTIALFSKDGRLKPGDNISTIKSSIDNQNRRFTDVYAHLGSKDMN